MFSPQSLPYTATFREKYSLLRNRTHSFIRKMKIKMKMTQKVTMKHFERRRKRLPSWKSARIFFFFTTVLALGIFAALGTQCNAQEAPKPDPSGVATGDKTTAVDGSGNP